MREARQPEGLATPTAPYSPVVIAGNLVFTAGQVAVHEDGSIVAGGIEEQTQKVLDNVERCLAVVDLTLDDVVKVTAFLANLEDFETYNRVYAERFTAPYPARSTVGVALARGLLVEIEVVARRAPG